MIKRDPNAIDITVICVQALLFHQPPPSSTRDAVWLVAFTLPFPLSPLIHHVYTPHPFPRYRNKISIVALVILTPLLPCSRPQAGAPFSFSYSPLCYML